MRVTRSGSTWFETARLGGVVTAHFAAGSRSDNVTPVAVRGQIMEVVALALAIVALIIAIRSQNRFGRLEARLNAFDVRISDVARSVTKLERAHPAPEPPPPVETPAAQPLTLKTIIEPVPADARSEAEAPAAAPPAPPPTSVPPVAPAGPSEPAAAPGPGFEERFGTRWVVWVGGIALALGGIFLVRYSIEQGLIGPRLRVMLGAALAAALVAAGEWMRRNENLQGIRGIPTAHIPSVLTAAGTTIAYATVYAAYALYGLLPPGAAFVLLGVVALLTLGAALLHGPALAALGLVGAYVTPLLVTAEAPNYWALYIYLGVVTAAAFALARARLWRWLAIAAVAFGVLWMFPGIEQTDVDSLVPHTVHAVVGFALVAVFIVPGLLLGPPAGGRISGLTCAALSAYLFGGTALVIASHHEGLTLAAFALLAAASSVIAWRAEDATAAVPAAAAMTALVLAHWAVPLNVHTLILPGGPAAGAVREPEIAATGPHLAFGAAFAVLFAAAGFLAQGRSLRAIAPILWAATAAAAPLAILMALYYRVAGFDRSIPFAGLALLIAAIDGFATESLVKREARPGLAAASAIFATGAVAALALALTLALERGWLTISLALIVPGIAWVADKRPLPALRWVAALIVVLVLARIGWEPRIVGRDIGVTPIFNWLLYGYGGPAAAFWLGAYLLRRRGDDAPLRIVEAGAILFTVLLAFLEIRHFMTHGDLFRQSTGLAELALQVSVGLAIAIGLERIRARTRSVVHDIGALVIAGLAALGIVLGLWIDENPFRTQDPVGGPFVNLVLLGYGLPAILVTALALMTRDTRPANYRIAAVVLGVGLALGYLTLEVSRLYQGPVLDSEQISQAEQYTHSAVWLAFGVALLLAGIALRSQPVRLASAAVVIVTVAKVFLMDLAGLEGVYRALSFIGLGLVLVGIGLLYQRLLFPPRRLVAAAAPTAAPPA